MDQLSRQKINKETLTLNNILDQMHLIDVYRTFHPFSVVRGTFCRMDHTLGHKTCLSKFKKIESYQASFLTTTLWARNQLQEKNYDTKHKHWRLNNI